jgi:hypothetical protein
MPANPLIDLQVGAGVGRQRRGRLLKYLVALGWLLALGGTFGLGYELAKHDEAQALAGVQALRAEAALLSQELARGRAERVRLERAHQIDREAKRQAQQDLADLQRERTQLSKRVSYLQKLLRDGDETIVEVRELEVARGEQPRHYRFDMVLSQLVPSGEMARGTARVSLVVTRDGKRETLSLKALPGSSPALARVGFKHFQVISGEIVLPEGVQAEQLVVDIEPETEGLAASSDTFLWPPEIDERRFALMPTIAAP